MDSTDEYTQKVTDALGFLRGKIRDIPSVILVMGTGLGELAERMEASFWISYEEIPGFPTPTVMGHKGNLVLGKLSGVSVAALQGRFHYYEGYSMKELTLPIRVLSLLGSDILITTNVSGGLNPDFTTGSFMVIADHLNLMGSNPLIGSNNDHWGLRFPDMSETYDQTLIDVTLRSAKKLGLNVNKGVYAAVTGPCLETPAELRMLKIFGADAVGMSTVPEVIVAKHAGLRVLAISLISNMNDPDHPKPVVIEEVIQNASEAGPPFESLIKGVLSEI